MGWQSGQQSGQPHKNAARSDFEEGIDPAVGALAFILVAGVAGVVSDRIGIHGQENPPEPFHSQYDPWGLETPPQPILGVEWESHIVSTSK